MDETTKRKRGGRGKGKRPAMEHITIRVPADVMEFYRKFPRFSDKMREALAAYVELNETL